MDIDQSIIEALIRDPAEKMAVEIKQWFDPTTNHGISKIAKGALALRNQNGGYLIFGFDDKSLQPAQGRPADVRKTFHPDTLQKIVSDYASDLFEIEVAWGVRDGTEYPVLVIPPGLTVPAVAKRDLKDGVRFVIREGAVYVRTLHSNGIISSAEAKARDWPELMERCVSNREADIGRFIRRHLSGLDMAGLTKLIGHQAPPAPSLENRAIKLIDDGETRYALSLAQRTLNADEQAIVKRKGFWSTGLIIDPPHVGALPDRNFEAVIAANNPQLSGWPMWKDTRRMSNQANRAVTKGNALEYLIISPSFSDHVDFARLDPVGEFFLHRLIQDDGIPQKITPEIAIDPEVMVWRVTEIMATGLAFARGLGWTPQDTRLGFAFRWHGLSGRQLQSWANPFLHGNFDGGTAVDDTVETFVELSLDTPLAALHQFVYTATRKLYVAFNGAALPPSTVEELANQILERRIHY